jgi:archaellum component FlaG (FlaF/FlaG flagellin family)
MEKTITTAFMVIVSIIVSVMVYNAVYPAAVQGSDSIRNMRNRMDARIQSQFSIVHAVGELDRYGAWHDTNGDGQFNVFVWTKNIGSARVSAIHQMDLFFGPDGNFTRIDHKDVAGGSYPYWDWVVENDTNWNPTSTLRITIYTAAPLPGGRYFIKLVLPTGVSEETFMSM